MFDAAVQAYAPSLVNALVSRRATRTSNCFGPPICFRASSGHANAAVRKKCERVILYTPTCGTSVVARRQAQVSTQQSVTAAHLSPSRSVLHMQKHT